MKYLTALLIFLSALSISAFAQTYTAFQLNTDKLEVGHEIHFVYSGAFSKKIDPRLSMYYKVNDHLRWKTLDAKYNGKTTTGSFIIPDSTSSIDIKTRNERDTTEEFIFNVTKNGKPYLIQKQSDQTAVVQNENIATFNKESVDLIKNKIPAGNFLTELTAMEIKYPKFVTEGKFDRIYTTIAHMLFAEGDINNAERYVDEIRFKYMQKEFYVSAVRAMLNSSSSDFHLAEKYIERAIALEKFQPLPYYVFDKKQWNQMVTNTTGDYFDLAAQIQYKLGNIKQAINCLDTAMKMASHNVEIKAHYLQYLMDTGDSKVALDAASKYIEDDQVSAEIKNFLQKAYVKENGGVDGYNNYFQSLMKKGQDKYVLPEYGKLNVPAINFSLQDINGKTISLTDFKGKPVILYFFSTYYNNTQRDDFNNYFNKIVKEYSGSPVVFLAIDKGRVSEQDEANGRLLRIQRINEFLTKSNLSFKVLMDNYHQDKNPNSNFYYTADNYSSGDVCQFYVIDKNRIVRYKSFPYTPMPMEQFEHELNAALKLVD